ncbi:MAG: hypothetical protein CMJ49_02335 [Planctomycetaceae bacterium]|nr:hypothetical protein [Planctomycetaceae bacterium]
MPARQQLLVLYLSTPDLNSGVTAWSMFDGTGRTKPKSGDAQEPPYDSVVAAMRDGWRVIQFPQQLPPYPGMEYTTSFLKHEYILERMVEDDQPTQGDTP